MASYNHQEIEKKWQERWEKEKPFAAVEDAKKEKRYVLDMFPYPSGAGLHVGHPIGYIATDIISRKLRMDGFHVLHPMGWDAFGLPAENYAIKTGVHPAISTAQNAANFRRQLTLLGLSYDWSREISSCDPAYYKWTQWLFLLFYKNGLAYKRKAPVNWCEKDQTVLANEQVVDGACERCGTSVIQKELEQWFFGITKYADRLIAGLEGLDWPDRIKTMQKNWIGRSEGAEIVFSCHPERSDGSRDPSVAVLPQDDTQEIRVFTTRPDTIFGVSYIVLSPEHALVDELTTEEHREEMNAYRIAARGKSELERTQLEKDKSGVFTGSFATHPITGDQIQIWVSDYVLMTYGTGAVMGVPAHDERDALFAKKYGLSVTQVIAPHSVDPKNPPRPGEKNTVRKVAHVILENAKGEVLTLNLKGEEWGNNKPKTLVIGGIEEGETVEMTALREIREETGYADIEVTKVMPIEFHAEFYAAHKRVNRYVKTTGVVCRLKSDKRTVISGEEQKLHDLVWVKRVDAPGAVTIPDDVFLVQAYLSGAETYTDAGVLVNSGVFNGLTSVDAKKKIVEELAKNGKGEAITKYRLRDWLVSRQRYWGAPIPIVYDPEGKPHPVKEEHLPLLLPTDVDYLPKGTSPIGTSKTYAALAEQLYGKDWHFETDTMDTFVDSSWYFLRFTDPTNTKTFADRSRIDHWCPIDLYVGGAEHAVLHLLYARFFTYVLHDLGYVGFEEPFRSLRNQGLILGPDGEKMSKSKGNVINPDDIVMEFGADAMRLYEMFMAPFDVVKPWDTRGIVGVRRFLDKVWHVRERVSDGTNASLARVVHKTTKRVTEDIQAFRFNTAVAQLMMCANEMQAAECIPRDLFSIYIRLLTPFAPHVAEELWEVTGEKGTASTASWPVFEEALTKDHVVQLAVQVNGKLRGTISVPADIENAAAKEQATTEPNVAKHLAGHRVQKVIYIPGRLVNFVLKD